MSLISLAAILSASLAEGQIRLARESNWLVIRSPDVAGGEIRINYLEAYCRANSANADWVKHTVVPHTARLVSNSGDGRQIKLQDSLSDGVTVEHTITAAPDGVIFRLDAHNPGKVRSEAHWAQPCVRLGAFTGHNPDHRIGDGNDYLSKCFVFLEGKLSRMPTRDWATTARYMPGQVWRPESVPASDVNPRPLNPNIPSNGLIGCFSGDEKFLFATAWEPWQELFQGVARCVHSDFRLGGLKPGERKQVRGRIYLMPNNVPALLKRYKSEFPEHRAVGARRAGLSLDSRIY